MTVVCVAGLAAVQCAVLLKDKIVTHNVYDSSYRLLR